MTRGLRTLDPLTEPVGKPAVGTPAARPQRCRPGTLPGHPPCVLAACRGPLAGVEGLWPPHSCRLSPVEPSPARGPTGIRTPEAAAPRHPRAPGALPALAAAVLTSHSGWCRTTWPLPSRGQDEGGQPPTRLCRERASWASAHLAFPSAWSRTQASVEAWGGCLLRHPRGRVGADGHDSDDRRRHLWEDRISRRQWLLVAPF